MKKMKKILLPSLCLGILITLMSMASGAWQHLGSRKVSFGMDHDRITVTWKDGSFSKLKFAVNGQLNMHRAVVTYGNGTKERLDVKHNFTTKNGAHIVDLKGNRRIIKYVDFWYDTKNRSRKRATVRLFGL